MPEKLDVLCPTCGEKMVFLSSEKNGMLFDNARFTCSHEHVFSVDQLMGAK